VVAEKRGTALQGMRNATVTDTVNTAATASGMEIGIEGNVETVTDTGVVEEEITMTMNLGVRRGMKTTGDQNVVGGRKKALQGREMKALLVKGEGEAKAEMGMARRSGGHRLPKVLFPCLRGNEKRLDGTFMHLAMSSILHCRLSKQVCKFPDI